MATPESEIDLGDNEPYEPITPTPLPTSTINRGNTLRGYLGLPTPDQQKLIIDARRDPRLKGMKIVTYFSYFVTAIPIIIILGVLGYLEFIGVSVELPVPWTWLFWAGAIIIALCVFRIFLIENVNDFTKWAYDITTGTGVIQLIWGIFQFLFSIETGGADIVVGGILSAYLLTHRTAYMEWSRQIWGW